MSAFLEGANLSAWGSLGQWSILSTGSCLALFLELYSVDALDPHSSRKEIPLYPIEDEGNVALKGQVNSTTGIWTRPLGKVCFSLCGYSRAIWNACPQLWCNFWFKCFGPANSWDSHYLLDRQAVASECRGSCGSDAWSHLLQVPAASPHPVTHSSTGELV